MLETLAVLPPSPPSKFFKENTQVLFFKLAKVKVTFFPKQQVNFYWNSFLFEQNFFTHFDCDYVENQLTLSVKY